MSVTRPLGLDRGNGAVCQITTEPNAILEVDIFILSFCFDIRSLLRSMILVGWTYIFLSSSTTKSAFNVSNFFWLIDNWRLLRGAKLIGGGSNIVIF